MKIVSMFGFLLSKFIKTLKLRLQHRYLLMFQHLLLYAFFLIATNNVDTGLCLIALPVLLVFYQWWIWLITTMKWLSTSFTVLLPFFFISLVIQESPLNWSKISKPKKVNGKLMVLIEKGGVCLFENYLREVSVSFKTKGGGCNFS